MPNDTTARAPGAAGPAPAGAPQEGRELLLAAAATGALAGGAMLAFASAAAAAAGLGASRPLVLAAGIFTGDAGAGAGAALLGALVWAVASVLVTLPFVALAPRDYPFVSAAVVGVGYAALVLAIASAWILPWINPAMRAAMPEMGGAWVIAYGLYGVGLGLAPALRRRVGGGAARASRPPARRPAYAR